MKFHAKLRKNIHPVCPHIMIFPGLSIMLTGLVFNYLGDELRDLLDPGEMKNIN
jgi:peptide/nickel transport system permease protein